MSKLWLVFALALLLFAPAPLHAEEEHGEEIPLEIASDEEAEEALKVFKEAYKARGLRGDEKTAVREVAMRKLSEVQHPEITDRLAKLGKDRNEDIRTLAVMYLGNQTALPGYAGPAVIKLLRANWKDPVYVMFAIDAIEQLDYRGEVEVFRDLLKHKDDGVRKVALLTIGAMQEMRMVDDIIQMMVDLKIDKGMKWEGGEVTYDTGTPGTHDQEMAEKIYKEKYGNKAKGGRKAGRAMRDFKPVVLETMKLLTGEEFISTKQAKEWREGRDAEITAFQDRLDARQKEQEEAAKAMD